jgi:molybdopterin molybdotransferase
MLSYANASRVVREHADRLAPQGSPQSMGLLDSLNRVLAEPVYADRDQPPFPRSTRDGFACRAHELAAGRALCVTGLIRAGDPQPTEAIPGKSIEIMTGAAVPVGADCVVMLEHVEREGDTIRLSPSRSIAPGDHIIPKGAEARERDVILPKGARIGPAQIAAAAACGAAQVVVFPQPRVAIVATGDELVEVEQQPLAHQIRNSNSYSLAAQVSVAGALALRFPTARDEKTHLEALIRAALDSDLLLLSGGVSMGKYDLVEEVLLSLGAEFFFTGASIQPGKPIVFGKLAGIYFFGLPGNPVSTMVTFSLFVRPLLDALSGDTCRGPLFALAQLGRDVRVKSGLTRFLPALLRDLTVDPVAWQGSGDLAGTSRANCFLVVPEDRESLTAGETVKILLASS